jgi:hypothetical protein
MHRDHAGCLIWGCQRAGEYAIKGRLIHATQPWFVFWVAGVSYFGFFQYRASVRSLGPRFAGRLRLSAASSGREVEFLEMMGHSLNKPMSAEEAETEARQQFAVRANSIMAFIECDEEQRPKLRQAIIEAMLWAQTQPKLAR